MWSSYVPFGPFYMPILPSQLSSSQIPWKVLQDAVGLVEEPSVGAHLHIQQKTQQCKKPRRTKLLSQNNYLNKRFAKSLHPRNLSNFDEWIPWERWVLWTYIWQFLVSMLNFPGIYLNWIYRPHSGCWLSALGWHWQGVPTQNLIIQLYMVMAHTT